MKGGTDVPMRSVEEARKMLARMSRSTRLAADMEATGLNCKGGEHHAMGISITDELGQSAYFPFWHPLGTNLPEAFFTEVCDFLNQSHKTIIWHNIKFDYQALRTVGVDIRAWRSTQLDTMICMYLLNEEFPSYELDYLAKRFLEEEKETRVKQYADAFGWENVTSEMMDSYARQDTTITIKLDAIFIVELRNRPTPFGTSYDLAVDKTRFAMHLGEIERVGVGVVNEFCKEMAERGQMAMDILRQRLGFNPGSQNELGEYLINYMQLPILEKSEKTGKPSFNKKVMEKYMTMLEEIQDESAKNVLDYRGWQKATSSLYLPMIEKQDWDGRVRTEFRQCRTSTGRLASANPNLQQIPRWTEKEWNGKAKQAFWTGWDDFDLIGYDYSQLELRLATAYGQDQALIDIFADPTKDVFKQFALDIMGVLNEDTRYRIKNQFIYPINYGAGKRNIKNALGVTFEEVEGFYNNYHRAYPGLFTASKETEKTARTRGYIKYWTGRRRHCRYQSDAFKMWNSLLQGGAAELVERAMLRAPNDENCIQVLQVHDEIVFAIRKGMRHIYEPLIIEAMTDWNFGVTLKVQGAIWNEGK